MALAVALVVVGGIALVSSLSSKSGKPGSGAQTTGTQKQSAQARAVYGELKPIGKARVLAQSPGGDEVYIQGDLTRGDNRPLTWPNIDLTIYTPGTVELIVDGKKVDLGQQAPANLRFRGGKLVTK
ncbi:hypothetical protein [Actinocorallia longicatena]|uniref:hypothetical protein n=1 Tax=Actinocorallia longicatena TaxID=111803 RepID=UPI0031E34A7E